MKTKERLLLFVAILALLLQGCGPDAPDLCGENVKRVVSMDFNGPTTIETTPDYDFAGYDVTITIEREGEGTARVCYVVRDDDPWTKLFWSVDDVLTANVVTFRGDETTVTAEGDFALWAKDDDEVCGAETALARTEGCSGEREAEVYLMPYGSSGAESDRQDIRVD